jgi:hypothetical protein
MKKFTPLLFLLAVACSNQIRVRTDFDREVEIHRFTTYSWLDVKNIEQRNNPIDFNELTDKRVKQAVDRQMKEKGYEQTADSAQLIVHYHITVEDKVVIRPEPYGYTYGDYWLDNKRSAYRYQEGTLIIDFMDRKNKNLIWRGWAVSVLDGEKMITEDLINEAAAKIFAKFPMSIAKEVREL